MAKAADAFRTISEVAEWLEIPAHVLRFWESKFTQIKPVKRAGGRRYYRPSDMLLLGGIKVLLHDQGMTIKGAQKYLRENGIQSVAQLSQPLEEMSDGKLSDIALDVDTAPARGADVLHFSGGDASQGPSTAKADTETATHATSEPDTATDIPTPDTPSAGAENEADTEPSEENHNPAPIVDETNISMQKASEPDQGATPPPDTSEADTPASASVMPDDATAPPATPTPEAEADPDQQDQLDTETGPEADTASEPTPPAPLAQPDLPEDPPDTITATPGALAAIAALPRPLTSDLVSHLEPLLSRLKETRASKPDSV
ncbi:MerR family transcriptional regulator [uncultured Roseovarius sp.]|uniref:MerR family transcriptional regulator n=1 Tax=uncultured Roseovarius sp. TaxID=293344 RepID=UPI00260884CE|nr:MerR family transcriptional regulator [uncultured Roseovarius sp.]